MNNINKNDLLKLLDYALDEYGDPRHMSPELTRNGTASMRFGTLDAEISMIEAKKNELYLRKYIVRNNNGNGFSFILGHSAMLFANAAKKFREKLVAEKCIKGVITLKKSVFKFTTIPAAIIVLEDNATETWFTAVDSVELLADIFENGVSSLKKVYYSENISADNLNPEYYNGDDKVIEEALKEYQTATLEEIAEIIPGKAEKREFLSEQGIAYLRGRDLQNGKIMKPELYVNPDNVQKFANCILQEGDILLTKNFGQNKLTYVTEGDLPAIASNGLIIIRTFGVSEKYLYKYLTSQTGSEVFNKQLSLIQKGVTIPSISIADLKKLLVPILDDKAIQELESKPHITKENVISAARTLLNGLKLESNIENIVYADLISAGWQEKSMKRCDVIRDKEDFVNVTEDVKTLPDLSYKLDDGRYVYIEIKTDLQHITLDWVKRMQAILKSSKYSFLIITTGVYYEIHKAGVNDSLKLLKAPSIQDILDWEKEVL